jgi:pimeloyl-ACP methyl ester carboxylesterase
VEIESKYADVGEIRVHFRTAGSGVPIVFLHAGSVTSETWSDYLLQFSDSFWTIAPDSRGQGQTTIGAGPLTYGRMAGDVVRLLDWLEIDRAHVVGQSDGGCVATHLLIDYPDRVRSGTLLGTPFHVDDYPDEARQTLENYIKSLAACDPGLEAIRSMHTAAENPGQWARLTESFDRMWGAQPSFSDKEIELIDRPVLLVKTDRDPFVPAHVIDRVAGLVDGAQVLYLPEGTHTAYREMSGEVSTALGSFIESVGGV